MLSLDEMKRAVLEEYPKAYAAMDNPHFWFIIKKQSEDGFMNYFNRIDPSMAQTQDQAWERAYKFLYDVPED